MANVNLYKSMTYETREDVEIKLLVDAWWKKYHQHQIRADKLRKIAIDNNLFKYFDLSTRSGQIGFSLLIKKKLIGFISIKKSYSLIELNAHILLWNLLKNYTIQKLTSIIACC